MTKRWWAGVWRVSRRCKSVRGRKKDRSAQPWQVEIWFSRSRFSKPGKRLCRCFGIGVVRPKFGSRFTEGDFAGIAAPKLDGGRLPKCPNFWQVWSLHLGKRC
jgi:hypothetical protein